MNFFKSPSDSFIMLPISLPYSSATSPNPYPVLLATLADDFIKISLTLLELPPKSFNIVALYTFLGTSLLNPRVKVSPINPERNEASSSIVELVDIAPAASYSNPFVVAPTSSLVALFILLNLSTLLSRLAPLATVPIPFTIAPPETNAGIHQLLHLSYLILPQPRSCYIVYWLAVVLLLLCLEKEEPPLSPWLID